MIGASRIAVVLRIGGTAALVVAAVSVPGGSGELELALVLADGLFRG